MHWDPAVSEYVAHCLDLDIVDQGATEEAALERLVQACYLVIVEDLARQTSPLTRKAPAEEWVGDLRVVDIPIGEPCPSP